MYFYIEKEFFNHCAVFFHDNGYMLDNTPSVCVYVFVCVCVYEGT